MIYEELGADQSDGINYAGMAKEGVEEGFRDIVKYGVIIGTVLMLGSFIFKGKLIKKLSKDLV